MSHNHKQLFYISLIGIFGGVVFMLAHFTGIFAIPVGVGEIEFSDVVCFLLLIISRKYPFIIIAIFPAFFSDLISFPIYAPATLISRMISTIIIVTVTQKLKFNDKKDFFILLLTLSIASLSIIGIYFLTDMIAFSISLAMTDLIVNFIQYTSVVFIVLLISVFYIKNLKQVIEAKLK